MTKTNKILIGVGAIALAYYFYTKRGKGSVTSNETQSTPKLGGDVDKNYDKCLKEYESSPMPNVARGFNFKQYKEDYINNCMKKSQQKPYMPQVTNGSTNPLQPSTIPNAYRLKEDFSKSVMTRPNVFVDVKFKKGQIISALRNPYEAQNMAVGRGALTTTIQGGLPNFEMSGQVWVTIPERILEKV